MDMSWLNVSLLIWSFIIEQWLIHNVSIQLIDYNQRFLSLFTIYLICNIAINKYLQNFLIAFACSFNIKLILIHINLSLLLLVSLLNISLSNHCSLIVIDENYFIIYYLHIISGTLKAFLHFFLFCFFVISINNFNGYHIDIIIYFIYW